MPGPGPSALWPVLTIVLVAVLALVSLWLIRTTGHRGGGGRDKLRGGDRVTGDRVTGGATPAPDELRAADADRERVAATLRAHTSAGRITPDELDDRLTAVYAARTIGELRRILADLPGGPLER
jgi:hypothetical protein